GPRRAIRPETPPSRGRRARRRRTTPPVGCRSRGGRLLRTAEDRLVDVLHLLVLSASADEGISEAAQGGPPVLRLPQHPDVHHQVFERPALVEVPEDQIEFSDDEFEHVDLAVEELHQVRFDGVFGPYVDDVDLALLAEAMDPSDPLLDPK